MAAGRGTVTIVVPTHNRYDRLNNLLGSIGVCALPYVTEVVVVDDSEVPLQLPNFTGDIPVRHVVLNSRVLISAAKNAGWRIARSEFVFFIDDDNVVETETFEPLCSHIFSLPDTAALMPAVLYKRNREIVWVYSTPLAGNRWSFVLVGRNLPRNSLLEGQLQETDALPNACIVRRIALESTGGFDESLRVNSSAYLCQKLKLSGWKVQADTGSFIYHDVSLPQDRSFWAYHAMEDPDRVFHEVRDWFVLMHRLHPDTPFFRLKAILRSLRFLLPNTAAYVANGGSRRFSLLLNVVQGLVEGLKITRSAGI